MGGLSPSRVLSGREGSGPYVGGLFEYAACRVCVLGAGGVECEKQLLILPKPSECVSVVGQEASLSGLRNPPDSKRAAVD